MFAVKNLLRDKKKFSHKIFIEKKVLNKKIVCNENLPKIIFQQNKLFAKKNCRKIFFAKKNFSKKCLLKKHFRPKCFLC